MAKKRIILTTEQETQICRAYRCGRKGAILNLATQFGISTSSISRHAARLGCQRLVKKTQRTWEVREIEILEANAHKELSAINFALIKAGFASRSLESIRNRLQRQHLTRREAKIDAGIYTQTQLAKLLGMHPKTVNRHIASGRIKAEKRKGVDQTEYCIAAKNVRSFIIDYAPNVDVAACDKYWLIDILTGAIK